MGVCVPVAPVVGFTGNFAQYFVNCWEIFFLVSVECLRPVFAAAILSRCCCGISLRHCLFIVIRFIVVIIVITVIVVITRIGFIINIV